MIDEEIHVIFIGILICLRTLEVNILEAVKRRNPSP